MAAMNLGDVLGSALAGALAAVAAPALVALAVAVLFLVCARAAPTFGRGAEPAGG
jgi:hypothetical protein